MVPMFLVRRDSLPEDVPVPNASPHFSRQGRIQEFLFDRTRTWARTGQGEAGWGAVRGAASRRSAPVATSTNLAPEPKAVETFWKQTWEARGRGAAVSESREPKMRVAQG